MRAIRLHSPKLFLPLAVVLLAAVLRIYNITQQSIWFDEAFAWNIIIQDDMYPRIASDTHPPLYYLLLRIWSRLAGDSSLALRYLSALTSIMTVALVYRVALELARRHRMSIAAPVLVALMLALSDAEIFLAQEARNYALYTFFATGSMWAYLRWLRRSDWRQALWWAAGNALLIYTHYQGLFIPAIQALHLLLFVPDRKRGLAALALSAVPVLPWFIWVTIPQAQNAIDNSLPYAIPSNWDTLLHLRDNYLGAMWALMLVLAGSGLWALQRRRGDVFLVVLWFALPFGVLFFGNYFASLLTERKLLIVAPAIALMVGYGLASIRPPARGLLAAVLVVYGLSAVDYYRVKEPWDQIAAQILPYAQPSDLAMVEAGVGQYPMKYYWTRWLPDGAYFTTFPFLRDQTMAPTLDYYTYYDALLPQYFAVNQAEKVGDVATAWLVFWGEESDTVQRLEQAGYVRSTRIPTDHLGNQIELLRYDYLPEGRRATYQNNMVLRAVEIHPEALRVDLWWSADGPIDHNYTTSVMLLDANGFPVAQKDNPPPVPTTTWQPDDVIYDSKQMTLLHDDLPPGEYQIIVKVYLWSPDSIEDIPTIDGDPWMVAGRLNHHSLAKQ